MIQKIPYAHSPQSRSALLEMLENVIAAQFEAEAARNLHKQGIDRTS